MIEKLIQFSVSHLACFCTKVSIEEFCLSNAMLKCLMDKASRLESSVQKVSELSLQIQSVVVARPEEASFKFELAGVSEFFRTIGNKRRSDGFWCGGLKWYLFVEYNQNKQNASKSLAFYLQSENDDPKAWSCKVHFELILFSKLSSEPKHISKRFSNKFNGKTGFGQHSFVSYRDLFDQTKGFIADDKILLGVEMKAEPVRRG